MHIGANGRITERIACHLIRPTNPATNRHKIFRIDRAERDLRRLQALLGRFDRFDNLDSQISLILWISIGT